MPFIATSRAASTSAVVYNLREETFGNYQLSAYNPVIELFFQIVYSTVYFLCAICYFGVCYDVYAGQIMSNVCPFDVFLTFIGVLPL